LFPVIVVNTSLSHSISAEVAHTFTL